jgi:hypothetical protein
VAGTVNAGYIGHNLLEGYTVGIHGTDWNGVTVSNNVVRRMADAGIDVHGSAGVIDSNLVSDSGVGIRCDLTDQADVRDNTVIRVHGYSDDGEPWRGHGLFFRQPNILRAQRNVVMRCSASGMFVWTSRASDLVISGNTSANNGDAGIEIGPEATANVVTVQNNVVYGNRGWGLSIGSTQESVALGCNDWYGNESGAVSGAPSSVEDLAVDPGFCDPSADDMTLAATSPLATNAACGQIGAKGVGCEVTAGSLGAAERSVSVTPNPSHGAVDIEWTLAGPGDTEIRVYDLSGRRIATVTKGRFDAGRHGVRWDGLNAAGDHAAPGWYVIRVTWGAYRAERRLLLFR